MERTYFPDRRIRIGFLVSWKEMFFEVFQSRELIWRLFLRDFSAKYRQSFLGVAWVVIMPFITIGVFVYLNRSGILNIRETGTPYVVFALIGITIYNLFSNGLTTCTNSIVSAGRMVTKINFPKISLVMAAFGQALVELAVRLVLLAIVFILYGVTPSWIGLVLFPFSMVPLMLLTLGLGMVLGLATAVIRDVANVVSVGTMFLMFLTPVVYPIPAESMLSVWNPLSHFVVGGREVLLQGSVSNIEGLALASGFSLLVFFVAWRLFYLAETKIAERI